MCRRGAGLGTGLGSKEWAGDIPAAGRGTHVTILAVKGPGTGRPARRRPGSSGGRGFRLPGSRLWTSNRVSRLAVCGLLLLAVGLVFGQTAGFGFVNYDDDAGVYENRLVTGELTLRSVLAVFTERHVESWAPLTCLSHMLVWHLFGHGAAVHHLINVLLHAASAVLLFLVLWRMTGRLWPSALVAAVFAVHPLRAESVAWVTERKDVLSGLFFLLTLAAYLGYVAPTVFRSAAIWPCSLASAWAWRPSPWRSPCRSCSCCWTTGRWDG